MATSKLAALGIGKRLAALELLRRLVLEDGRIDVLALEVLGYEMLPFHKSLIDFQSGAGVQALQLAPRGFGKSTILTITRTIFEIIRNPNVRILIASNTQLQAEVFLREVKFHFEQNELLRQVFGDFVSKEKWDTREIFVAPRTSVAKESTITCVGVSGAVASRHYDLIIGDDLVDEENSYTEIQREKVRTWFYKTLLPCVADDRSRVYLIGTRYHPLDLYGHLIKNEFSRTNQVVPAIAPDGSTPWPERFSAQWLERKRREMGSAIFNSQYQNDTSLMKGNIFLDKWFRYYDTQPNWSGMRHFVGGDPAATKRDALLSGDHASSDWWTIIVGAVPSIGAQDAADIYVRDVWRGRCSKDAYLQKLREFNELYKPVVTTIETNAAQEYLAQDAEKFMPVHRVNRTTDKVARAYWLQAFFENGQILFADKSLIADYETWQAMKDELLLFPQGQHDDLFDGLQTMVEGAMEYRNFGTGGSVSSQSVERVSVSDWA